MPNTVSILVKKITTLKRHFYCSCAHLFILVTFLSLNGYVVSQQYFFKNISIEDGLIQSQVNDIKQDKNGYLWISTNGGVSKFDGKTFENFSINHGLTDNQVNTITLDQQKNIWFGTLGALCEWNGKKFIPYQFPKNWKENFVLYAIPYKDSTILIGTDGDGLLQFNIYTKKYTLFKGTDSIKQIRHIALNKNTIWLTSISGIFTLDNSTQWNPFAIKEIPNNRYSSVNFQGESIWISTYGYGIIQITKNDTLFITEKQGLISNSIRKIYPVNETEVWFISKIGLSVKNDENIKSYSSYNGLENPSINVLYIDTEKNYWFGSDGKGLYKFNGETVITYSKTDGLCSNIPMSFIEDEYKNLWIGTYDQGICSFSKNTSLQFKQGLGIQSNTIWDITKNKNTIWIATSEGIAYYQNNTWKTIREKDGLTEKRIYCIKSDSKNNIWMGVRQGIIQYNGRHFTRYYQDSLYVGQRVMSISIWKDEVWVGSSEGLVQIFNEKIYSYKLPKQTELKKEINAVYADSLNVWIGTNQGIFVFNKKQKNFVEIVFTGNFGSNYINSITKDDFNHVWCGTNYGIFVIFIDSTGTYKYKMLNSDDGIPSLECNQNAIYKDSENQIWVGTVEGICKINPIEYWQKKEAKKPVLHIKTIKLFLEDIDWSTKKTEALFNHEKTTPYFFKFPYNKNHITFEFTGIFFRNPQKVIYRYMLEGFDQAYSPQSNNYVATYSNLPPGKYTFKVIASSDETNWTNASSIQFTISPPFWLRKWFILLCTIMVTAIAYSIHYTRNKLRKRKLETERLGYQARLLELEQQALNASMNRHFVFNSLNSIQYYINVQDRKSANLYLTKFAKLIRKNLDDLQNEHVLLSEEIERIKIYLSLEEMRFEGSFTYTIEVSDDIKTEKLSIPTMILQPFVENSIIHGILPSQTPGSISIKINKKNSVLHVVIDDNGIGIEKSKEQKTHQKNTHVSKGMIITNERLNVLKKVYQNDKIGVIGPEEIYSDSGQILGTRVELFLPYFETHDNITSNDQ